MQCGHCGSQINKGFATCPACGAVYQKRVGCVAEIIQYFGFVCLLAGVLELFGISIHKEPLPIGGTSLPPLVVWLAIGIGSLMLHRLIVLLTPYRWYR
jgi:hypothetical protein